MSSGGKAAIFKKKILVHIKSPILFCTSMCKTNLFRISINDNKIPNAIYCCQVDETEGIGGMVMKIFDQFQKRQQVSS
jgi:hypothetical protein